MSLSGIEIVKYKFSEKINQSLSNNFFAQNLWPIVYIIEGGVNSQKKVAYVGETADLFSRMNAHLKNELKKELDFINIITCDKFNKSATLDVESNLIKYISGEDDFKLLNGNLGLANHNYYQKEELYWEIFKKIWDQLRSRGVVKRSIEDIENSDIFKYSPYKSLNKDQADNLLKILQQLAKKDSRKIIIEGGAGTGKSILAVFLFKLLSTNIEDFSFKEFGALEEEIIDLVKEVKKNYPNIKMGLVVPMASFRKTLKNTFKNVKGLNQNMVIAPSETVKSKYDLLVVDESHRLKRRINLANYKSFDEVCKKLGFEPESSTELDWILKQSKNTILFYDENQSIKPTDIPSTKFKKLISQDSILLKLNSQFRSRGGDDYVQFVDSLLKNHLNFQGAKFNSAKYSLLLFESLEEMIEQIKEKNNQYGLSRIVAGFSWEWISKNNKDLKDIKIGDCELMWNSVAHDWINSSNSINEVGCIHTVQGYDLNYCGIIFGNEISYDPINNKIIINPDNYCDKNGKNTIKDPKDLENYIINIYKTMMLRGIRGTYIFACDQNLKKYFESFINKFESKIIPNPSLESELMLLDRDEDNLEEKMLAHSNVHESSSSGLNLSRDGGSNSLSNDGFGIIVPKIVFLTHDIKPFLNSIPFYDLRASAGSFSELQNISDVKWVQAPKDIKISQDLFVCQIEGESMNKIIPNGSYCLFKKDLGGSRNGKIVLVESLSIEDFEFGSRYTIKEYQSVKYEDENGWRHQSIILKPRSNDLTYKNIELNDSNQEKFKVVGIFERVIANSQS